MSRLRLVGLGLRLATAGGRPAWIRLGLMAFGFMLGSGLLLSATSVVPAFHARDVREYRRYGVQRFPPPSAGFLREWGTTQQYGDLRIQMQIVEAIGAAPIPPGLSRVPRPGQLFASPALAAVWEGRLGTALESRLDVRLAGTIARPGVVGPDELFAWVGRPRSAVLPGKGAKISSFRYNVGQQSPLDLKALLGVVGIASAVLLPIWLFVATVTRLSAATREARLAAVRLAGATEAQVRLISGVEAGLAAAVGVLLGTQFFLTLRPVLANGLFLGINFFPEDFAPPRVLALAIVIGLPLAAVLMTQAAMRRLIVSPLGVARRARIRHAGWRWSLVLMAGLAVLAWAASRHEQLMDRGQSEAGWIIGTALAMTAFGLTGTATWMAWLIARRRAGTAGSAAGLLGLRRLESDPSSVGRVVGGVALMIALVAVIQSSLVVTQREDTGLYSADDWVKALDPNAILVFDGGRPDPGRLGALDRLPGVTDVVLSRRDPYGGLHTRPVTVILRTDGRPGAIEGVRDEVAWYAQAWTAQQFLERNADQPDEYDQLRRGVMALTIFMLLVNGATLLVAMVDWVMERRRAMAVLSAVGVPPAVLRGSIVTQVGLPLATSVVFGVGGAVAVVVLLFTAIESPIVVPTRDLVLLSIGACAVVASVTALTMPWLRVARRAELLRNE